MGAPPSSLHIFPLKWQNDVLCHLMDDMGSGVDSYKRGTVLGETRSHQLVRPHYGQVQGSEYSHAAPAPRLNCGTDFKGHRGGRRLPGGTQHGLLHEPSPHLPGTTGRAVSTAAEGLFPGLLGPPPPSLGKVPGRQMGLALVQPWWQLLWGR